MAGYNREIYDTARSYVGTHMPYGTGAGHIDCSHFVAKIINQATGTHFDYMVANDYDHSASFTRVDGKPEAGDIVFWHEAPHGHVGVVLDPVSGQFIGSQSSHGVGTDHYNSGYWRHHGSGPVFLRYRT
jgi:cell wall-associated NlpC family hydrolase